MESELGRIAAIQASSVFLNREATVDKACRLIEEAAAAGAQLAVFPEAFVSAYPLWVWFIPPGKTQELRSLYASLHDSAVSVPGAAVNRLAEAAGDCGIAVAIGVNERNSEASHSSLYNTLLYLGADGSVLGRHRKMVPTAGERLVWAPSADADLAVFPLSCGRVGGLICWENYMPLARYALSALGEQIHLAPTWDRGEPWVSTVRHIGKESRCFVVSVCQAFHRDDIPDALPFKAEYLGNVDGWVNPGLSLIVDPDGKVVAGPLEKKEGILYCDVERHQLVGPRWQLDIGGHYARPDLFQLRVCRESRPFLVYTEEKSEPGNHPKRGETAE